MDDFFDEVERMLGDRGIGTQVVGDNSEEPQ
jgi:hypothetical protein